MNSVKVYTYKDNSAGKEVFSCEAESLIDADKLYFIKFGTDITKQPHISVVIQGKE